MTIELFSSVYFVEEITGMTENDGQYTWDVSNDLEASDDYYIKVTSYVDNHEMII